MSAASTIALGTIMASKLGSVDPAKCPDDIFDLYSIPAYDAKEPEVVAGSSIGSPREPLNKHWFKRTDEEQ